VTTTKPAATTTKQAETTTKPMTTTVYERTTKIVPRAPITTTIPATTTTAVTTQPETIKYQAPATIKYQAPATTIKSPTFRQASFIPQPSDPNSETLYQALARCSQVEKKTAALDAEEAAKSDSGVTSTAPCQDHSDRCDKMSPYCDDKTVATLCASTCNRCDLSKSKEEINAIRNNIQKQASKNKVDATQNIEYLECQKIKETQKACVDMLDDDECAGYVDYCDNVVTQKQCKRTCGICSNPGEVITTTTTTTIAPRTKIVAAGGTCTDTNPNCAQWENYCTMLDDVKQSCPVTCGTC